MSVPAIEVASDAGAELGEGPAWDSRSSELAWVDITPGRVHFLGPGGGERTVEVGQPVGAVVPRASGGHVLAVRDGFAALAGDGTVTSLAHVEHERPGNRMNDGKYDRHGRLWAGTMALDETPGAGALYRLDPDATVSTILEGVTISNGLAWSLDDRTMYYVDTPTQRIDRLDYDPSTGEVENRRPLFAIPARDGSPDGMALDSEGFLWVALHGGGAVRRYAPDGVLDRVIELPASNVTSCAFGGPELEELYITCARQGLSREQLAREPLAGALFRHRPGVRGLPTESYGG